MKALKSMFSIISIGIIITLSNCGPTPPPPVPIQDQQLEKLVKTWKIKTATLDNVDKTSSYTGFQLTITGTKGATSFGYTAVSRPSVSPWKASGSWIFGTDPVTMITRDADNTADKLDMTYSVTATQLQINFTYTGKCYTRTEAVAGNWVYTFQP
jgi:hypothetical protein